MKLSIITEGKRLDASEIVDKLKKLNIRANNYSEHVVSIKTEVYKIDQIKAVARYAKWQIHRMSKESKGSVYLDLTPIKNVEVRLHQMLYHVTETKFLDDITNNGLRIGSGTPDMNFPKRIYLHSTIEKAATWYHTADKIGLFANKKDLYQ